MSLLDRSDFQVVTRRSEAGETIVSVSGELDMATATQLLTAVGAALDDDGRVILDLADMTFIDAAGVNVLLRAHERARPEREARLVLRSPRPQVRKVLELTGLDHLLTIGD